jgi:hypothetical protein
MMFFLSERTLVLAESIVKSGDGRIPALVIGLDAR